jgi:hypothetical protein
VVLDETIERTEPGTIAGFLPYEVVL